MKLTPKNWKDFQHYKHRSPPWIKLHKKFLDDYEFQCLPIASRALAPMLWLLASETDDGVIDGSQEKLAFRIRMSEKDFSDALNPLINMGFFDCESAMQAPCKQRAKTKKSRDRVEIEIEKEKSINSQAASASDDIQTAFDSYNLIAQELGLARAQVLSDQRKAGLRNRLKECGGLEGWDIVLNKLRDSAFLCGEKTDFRCTLDFIITKSKFIRIMEGNYDDTDPSKGTADRETERRRKAIAAGMAH